MTSPPEDPGEHLAALERHLGTRMDGLERKLDALVAIIAAFSGEAVTLPPLQTLSYEGTTLNAGGRKWAAAVREGAAVDPLEAATKLAWLNGEGGSDDKDCAGS